MDTQRAEPGVSADLEPFLAEPFPNGAGGYWRQSKRPLASLLFVLPLLVLYEAGVLVLGTQGIRNGADAWLRTLLDALGIGGYFALPVLTVVLLLAWHHTTGDSWRIRGRVLAGMLLESAAIGLLLVLLARAQGSLAARLGLALASTTAALGEAAAAWLARLVGFFGAGIYEEVLFRLLLLPAVAWAIGLVTRSRGWQFGGAIVLTSLAFSIAHYVGRYGDEFQVFTFVFRFLAGALFAVVFVLRGFGIAAGAHALYDIYVGMR